MSQPILKWYATEEMKKHHSSKLETAEEFFARGGQVQKFGSREAAVKKKLDAQKLLDAAVGTPYEKEVITFLRKQGIQVD